MGKRTGHAEVLGLGRFEAALGTRHGLAALVFEALAPHVVLAVARLAAQTRVLAVTTARLTCSTNTLSVTINSRHQFPSPCHQSSNY